MPITQTSTSISVTAAMPFFVSRIRSLWVVDIETVSDHLEASLIAYNNSEPWKNFKDIVALTDSDPNPSSIMTIEASDKEVGFIYDLNGRKLKRPSKGLYIKNGKKYLVK